MSTMNNTTRSRARSQGDKYRDVVEFRSSSKKKVNLFQKHHFFKPPILLKYEDVPFWQQDNPHIHGSYRPVTNDTIACFQSWLYLHNESLNIYTHLIPAIGFVCAQLLMTSWLDHYYPNATTLDHVVFSIFLISTVACLALSTMYHTMICHSHAIEKRFLKLDFVGIVVQILGSFSSGVYMGYRCESLLRKSYWTMIITFGLATISVATHSRFQGPRYTKLRTSCFVATAASGFLPILHGLYLFGIRQSIVQSGLPYYLLEGLLFGVGVYFFISRVPEAKWPGRFDVWFSSHSIFHVLVVCATMVHFAGLLNAYDWNYHHLACALPVTI